MSKVRMQKVAGMIKETLAEIFPACKDPRVGFVTITQVEVAPDLTSARVFVSILGEEEQMARSFEGLKSAEGFFRRELGKKIRLKKTPRVNFILDRGIQRGVDVVNLINQIAPPREVLDSCGDYPDDTGDLTI